MKKHFARLLLPLGVLCAAAALLFYPTQAAAGAKRCLDVVLGACSAVRCGSTHIKGYNPSHT